MNSKGVVKTLLIKQSRITTANCHFPCLKVFENLVC